MTQEYEDETEGVVELDASPAEHDTLMATVMKCHGMRMMEAMRGVRAPNLQCNSQAVIDGLETDPADGRKIHVRLTIEMSDCICDELAPRH